ncbi:hypothetical protein C7402_111286 [Paraburkholderia unamae]|uniref:NIL domain-containing protein n=1 Tax=Paraburkholderia unamae TaxID=219649 RepID=A0ABX5KKP9_9BURK|nr:hypothetical protein C7402_111286 [Paraburkholderia unamae]RAR54635.1 hypothetical protein C7401_124132 [Paraburkholderia unamae]
MSSLREHPAVAHPVCLTVRAAPGRLRIVPIWQALGHCAARARLSRVHCNGKQHFDELVVTFDAVSPAELNEALLRLNAQTWVITAAIRA